MKQVYLDYNATTPMDEAVIEVMHQNMLDNYGNPSSVHSIGGRAKVAMEAAREQIADIIGADPAEICFTSGGTEADNLALKGAAWTLRRKGTHLITSKVEHHAILESAHFMERIGFKVTYLNCDENGVVSINELREAIKPDTTIVSVMMANNETGEIQPVKEMADVCREAGVLFHTDAVQAVGKIEVNVKEIGADMLSLSAHKFYGPKGIGVLYIRKGVRVMPVLHGGSHERHKRAGTENTPAIVGMAKALELADAKRESEHKRLTELSDFFIDEVQTKVGEVILNGSCDNRIPSTVNLSFKGVEGEAIILSLDLKGIAVSSGSACASGSLMASHVLAAMNIDPLLAQGSIRFSMGRQTTREQLEYTISVLPDIINRLRSMSAAYNPVD